MRINIVPQSCVPKKIDNNFYNTLLLLIRMEFQFLESNSCSGLWNYENRAILHRVPYKILNIFKNTITKPKIINISGQYTTFFVKSRIIKFLISRAQTNFSWFETKKSGLLSKNINYYFLNLFLFPRYI